MRSSKTMKPNVGNILLFKFVQHRPITIAINCNCLSLLIFEEKLPNYASGPKFAPNSYSFWVRWLFNVCVRVFCAQMRQFGRLHTCQDQSELHLKRWFFCQNRQSNVAIFPSVVQSYTKSYSFGGRIKLIICEIRHELSVTIHEISTS